VAPSCHSTVSGLKIKAEDVGSKTMDQTLVEQYLAQAERRVADGEHLVLRQRKLTAELKHEGHDTKEAEMLLAQFEELLAMRVSDRDRLRKGLESLEQVISTRY
jgi:hypothetical protein